MGSLPVRTEGGEEGSVGSRGGARRVMQLALILCLLAVLRGAFLSHDPPSALVEWGLNVGPFLYDEGWWTTSAREHVLSGVWLTGGFDPVLLTPLSSLLFRGSFFLFGQGLAQARIVSGLFGMAGLLFLYAVLVRAFGRRVSLWTLLVAGVYVPLLISHRTALLESVTLFFIIASLWLWQRGSVGAHVGAGIAGTAAILTKLTAVAFVLPLFAATLVAPARSRLREALGLLTGIAVGGVVWWGLWGSRHLSDLARMTSFYTGPRWHPVPAEAGALASLLKMGGVFSVGGIMWRHLLFRANPAFALLALLGALACLFQGGDRSPERKVTTLAFWWLVGGGLLISLSPYQPVRYFVLLVPAAAVMIASLFARATTGGSAVCSPATRGAVTNTGAVSGTVMSGTATHSAAMNESGMTGTVRRTTISRPRSLLALFLIAWVTSQAAYALSFQVAVRWLSSLDLPQRSTVDPLPFSLTSTLLSLPRVGIRPTFLGLTAQDGLLLAAAIAALAALAIGLPLGVLIWHFVLVRRARRRDGEKGGAGTGRVAGGILIILALVSLSTDLARAGWWARWSQPSVWRMGQRLTQVLPQEAVVSPGGTYALGIEIRFDTSCLFRHRMWSTEPPVTHILVLLEHPLVGASTAEEFCRLHPGVEFIEAFRLLDGRALVGLFEIEAPAGEAGRGGGPSRPGEGTGVGERQ